MRRSFSALLVLCTAIPLAAAVAQDETPDTEPAPRLVPGSTGPVDEPRGPVDLSGTPDTRDVEETEAYERSMPVNREFGEGEQLEMRLSDAVAKGIENNLNLQVQRFDPLIAFEGQEATWGAFDPLLSLGGGYSDAYDADTNNLTGSGAKRNRARMQDAEASVDSLIPWLGASVGLDFGGSRVNTDSFSSFNTLKPYYETHANITATLPLLKGLIWNEPWTRVKTSAVQYQGSRENFRAQLMDVVRFIETQYWNLVAQKESVKVAEKSLETAQSLLDQTKTEYEVGVKSKVEVVEAEAGVAAREFELIRATNRYRRAQDDLVDAVLGTQLTPGSHIEIVPADDPEAYVAYQIDVVEAAEKAYENRPELRQAEYEVERQEYELKFAENQRLPQVDVVGSYGVGGTSGRRNDLTDPVTGMPRPNTTPYGGGFGSSYNDWFSPQGNREYSVRGVISIPIGNVGARHSVSRQRLALRQSKTTLTQLRQQIILEVRDGARTLESAQEGIQAAERRRLAAAEQLRAERVRLEYGESTPFNVLLKEEDLVEAENEKIAALFTYRESVVALHRAQGTILESRNIVVEEAAALRRIEGSDYLR